MKRVVNLNVNGRHYSVAVGPNVTLQDVLRDHLGLTGTKKGCQLGVCGACTVLIDGEPVNSCLVLAVEAEGKSITTIEGVAIGPRPPFYSRSTPSPGPISEMEKAAEDRLHPVQRAFVEKGAIQCGYCTPGMVMSAVALVNKNPDPSEDDIKKALGGNLCRCTGYKRIIDAIRHYKDFIDFHDDIDAKQKPDENGLGVVGKSVRRNDAVDKVTGRGKYTGDISLPDMLHGRVLRSPHAHARIRSIDTREAERLPGVIAVIAGRDVPDVTYGVSPARYDEHVLAKEKVRHVGDKVAAVAAVDEATAAEALKLIKVDYEILPHVLDPLDAMKDGAPMIHDKARKNVNVEVHQSFGDMAKGFAEADHIREDVFVTQRTYQSPIEPHAAISKYENGVLTVWCSTQVTHYVQHQLSRVLGLPMGRIRVIKPLVGGGFGGKAETTELEFCSAILAMKTGRPVKMVYRRDEMFLHGRGRHGVRIRLKTGVKKDGTITAVEEEAFLDGGAYTSFGIITAYYVGNMTPTLYKMPAFKYDGYRIYTNLPACGAMRGHGCPQPRFAFESQMDMIAEDLGIDPIEIRRRNAMTPNTRTVHELDISSCELRACLDEVEKASNWKKKKGRLPKGRGIGVGAGGFVSGAGYPIYRSDFPHSNAMIRLSEDGTTATLYIGAQDIGQGSDTVLAQIAAEEMGLLYEDVLVISGDTLITPLDLGSYSSRVTLMAGNAVRQAAAEIRGQVFAVAAERLNVPPERLEAKGRMIYDATERGRSMPFAEAAALAFGKHGPIISKGAYQPPKLGGAYKGATVGTSPAYSFGAAVAEVEVDMQTGKVKFLNFTDAHDVGQPINPMAVHGQVEGCASMGLGETVLEKVVNDEEGNIVNPNLHEYIIPGIYETPEINSIIVKSHEAAGPYGAKEVGEGAMLPVIGAIANAIYDATGVRVMDLPITPEKILEGIKKAEERQQATGNGQQKTVSSQKSGVRSKQQ